MNGKKARRLRQRAYNMTKGMVNTAYTRDPVSSATVLVENCTRAVYHKLKKQYLERKRNNG